MISARKALNAAMRTKSLHRQLNALRTYTAIVRDHVDHCETTTLLLLDRSGELLQSSEAIAAAAIQVAEERQTLCVVAEAGQQARGRRRPATASRESFASGGQSSSLSDRPSLRIQSTPSALSSAPTIISSSSSSAEPAIRTLTTHASKRKRVPTEEELEEREAGGVQRRMSKRQRLQAPTEDSEH
ncbi:hypothetical protein C8J56DRAFT_970231 [Mycena floridula]|nr:hypothetical protein C8J56DRAFT_970231 [Mycena floridula]